MRNEDLAEIIRTMEASFKQHADEQLAKFLSLLEQHIAVTDQRISQLSRLQRESGATVELTPVQHSVGVENTLAEIQRNEIAVSQTDMNTPLHLLPPTSFSPPLNRHGHIALLDIRHSTFDLDRLDLAFKISAMEEKFSSSNKIGDNLSKFALAEAELMSKTWDQCSKRCCCFFHS